MTYDFTIVGGGIVGLATGLALTERLPQAQILILEKERELAFHQTGHNSGVIHSGIYYAPGSFKARFCREGNSSMVRFCREHGIKHEVCGKIILATDRQELEVLEKLFERGTANGLEVKKLGPAGIREIEPYASGLGALWVRSTGIVNFNQVAQTYASLVTQRGGQICTNAFVRKVIRASNGLEIKTLDSAYKSRFMINCAGLQSDRVAKKAALDSKTKIVPFRGEYYTLNPAKSYLVKNLIYPVPNLDFPFLGVHLTRMIDGEIHLGPSAVLGFKREAYKKTDFNLRDFAEIVAYPGIWRLAATHWKEGTKEMVRSFSKRAFVRSLRRLVPEIEESDVFAAPAGVRAQALTKAGKLVDDFLILEDKHAVHVCNAPSPAATSSLEIGKYVADRALSVSESKS